MRFLNLKHAIRDNSLILESVVDSFKVDASSVLLDFKKFVSVNLDYTDNTGNDSIALVGRRSGSERIINEPCILGPTLYGPPDDCDSASEFTDSSYLSDTSSDETTSDESENILAYTMFYPPPPDDTVGLETLISQAMAASIYRK